MRPVMSRDTLLFVLMLVVLMAIPAVNHLTHLHDPAFQVGGSDPDSWLRLTLVRDWLSGGGWYDHSVVRTNAPFGGADSPWTRPIDVVLAGLVALQFWSDADLSEKLVRASFAMPILWAVVAVLGLARAVRRLCGLPIPPVFPVALIGTMPMIWNFFGAGNTDHHTLLTALWVWVVASMVRPDLREGWIAGALLGAMVWISPEALMLAGGMYVWAGLRYVWLGEGMAFLQRMTLAAALMAGFAVAVEVHPSQWLVSVYDRISIVQLAQLATCAVATAIMLRLPARYQATRMARLAAGGAVGGACILALWLVYPLSFLGPYADVDPFILETFLPSVAEARAPLREHWLFVTGVFFQPLLAVGLTLLCFTRHGGPMSRSTALTLLMLLSVTLGLYLMQQRWFYYLYPVVVLALVPWISALYHPEHPSAQGRLPARLKEGRRESSWVAFRIAMFMGCIAFPLGCFLAMPDPDTRDAKAMQSCEARALLQLQHGGVRSALGESDLILFAPTNIGAHVLFYTPYRIVTSNYHREGKALQYMWNADKANTEQGMRDYFAERGIGALLLCPDFSAPKDSYLLALYKGEVAPRWAVPVALADVMPKAEREEGANKGEEKTSPAYAPKLFRLK